MPFVSIRIAGAASKEQKVGIVADVTDALARRLGKNPAAVQIVIEEVPTENYGAGGQLIVDRDAPQPLAVEAGALSGTPLPIEGDAHADVSR